MRHEQQATGGSHDPDYVGEAKVPTILVPDVDRSNAIPVPGEPAPLVRATEYPPARRTLAAVPAPGAGTRSMGFFLQDDRDSHLLRFVGKQEANAPV